MNVTESRFKNRQLHMEDYLQMVSAEQKEYAEVFDYSKIAEKSGVITDYWTNNLLDLILRKGNLNNAYKQVKKNKGKGGIDGMQVDELLPFLRENQDSLIQEIREGKYKPNPVRRVEIPKETKGEFRKLGVPTVVDRVIQQAIAQELSPIYEEQFSENSFGFRPKRGAHDALRQCQKNVNDGYVYVVDMDLEKKLYAIKTEKEWQWLGKLYPAVFTRDRQVLLMSMDKFLSRNTTIVEPSYMFYNSDVIKDAIIFIDEFDATKETILKKIIDNGLHDKINYIELFKDIYASLHMDSFPAVLTTPSEERKTSKYSNQSLEGIVEGIKEKADYIFNTYSLQFKHRTSGEVEDLYQNYLFQDHQFHSILNANNSYITMTSDDKQRINSIGFAKTRPANEKNNIQVMLGQLRGFIKYFQGAVNILAINYMQCKKERRKEGEDAFTMEAAIRSVLSLFRLSPDSIDYLTSQIMISAHKIKGDIEPSDFDLSFYENGFRYYAFENDTAHDMQSQIMMYSFQNTPEKTLLRFCEKAKVIGISATATVPSVIGNFDIAYLKDKMQKVFVPLTDDERHRLSAEFEESQQGYNNVSRRGV